MKMALCLCVMPTTEMQRVAIIPARLYVAVAPIPRSIVRRDNAFFVTNMSRSLATPSKGVLRYA